MTSFDFTVYFLTHATNRTFMGEACCRMAAYFAQSGLCYVTGLPLEESYREMHHRIRQYYGGLNTAENTILVNKGVHKIIHSTDAAEIRRLVEELSITEEQLLRINGLRREAHMKILRPVSINLAA